MKKCFISGMDTTRNFHDIPVHQDVLEFARKYRDALAKISGKPKNLQGILMAFGVMKNQFSHTWETIQKTVIAEMKDKGISL